jgi:hypothetical protein
MDPSIYITITMICDVTMPFSQAVSLPTYTSQMVTIVRLNNLPASSVVLQTNQSKLLIKKESVLYDDPAETVRRSISV